MKNEIKIHEEDTRIRYIYLITNTLNKKTYVGQTLNPKTRKQSHFSPSRTNLGPKARTPLAYAINKYGEANFTFEVISQYQGNLDTDAAEKFFINHFNSLINNGEGYNVREGGNGQPFSSFQGKLNHGTQGKGRRSTNLTSQYLGVRKRGKNQFSCNVNVDALKSKEKNFATEIECAEAYDKIVLYVYGPKAIINFEDRRGEFLSLDLESFHKEYVSAPPKFPKTSNFNGVRRSYNGKRWMVKFVKKKKVRDSLVLGMFDTEEEAARMADRVMFCYGNDSNYNFPEEVENFDKEELERFFKSRVFQKKSKYKGVYRKGNLWTARYKENKTNYHLGHFKTEEEAHEAILKFIKDNNMNPHAPY